MKKSRRSKRRGGGRQVSGAGALPTAHSGVAASVESTADMSWRDRLFAPIDIASIAVFRICFGLLLLYDLSLYFINGWIKSTFIDLPYHFAFFGFDFIRALPGPWMYVVFGVLVLSSIMIAVGFFYRLAAIVFVILFSYIFLIDQSYYLNHFYFVGLLGFLLIFTPAARGWSLDAWIAGRSQDAQIPAWSLWLLRVQMEIMLIFAGIVKLNADWLQGEPLGRWLAMKSDLFLIGPMLTNETIAVIGAWSAALLHLIGAVMLLFKSTRLYAFAAYCLFHFLNHHFFNISIFPWLTIAATLLFFDPDWPKQVWRNTLKLLGLRPVQEADPVHPAERSWTMPSPAMRTAVVSLMISWAALQILIPLRHVLYPGDTSWHEQGHNFAWQMMLRQKVALIRFYVRDPDTGREWLVHPRRFLNPRQARFMAERPEMIRQFARHLEAQWAKRYGTRDVEVRAFTAVSLNGRRSQVMVDPKRDLTKVGYTFGPADWIVPLREPMPPKGQRWPFDERKTLQRVINSDPAMRRLVASHERRRKMARERAAPAKPVQQVSGEAPTSTVKPPAKPVQQVSGEAPASAVKPE